MTATFEQIPEQALAWHEAGQGAALATVVQTWGSAPRPVGSQLAINGASEMSGSVSGGCVEGAVVAEALEAIEDGTPRVLEFGVSDDAAFAVGLACGGTIRILVEPVGKALSADLLARIVARRAEGRAFAYLVNLTTWDRQLTDSNGRASGAAAQGVKQGATQIGPPAEAVEARFRSDKSGFEGDWFVAVQNPPLKMVVVGAVHIAQPLIQMARLTGFAPRLIDPREAFGSAARFPGETLIHDWPDEAVRALRPDHRTAVVTLTHDPKLDDPAILATLDTPAFYLGCLGSTRTHAKRVARMKEAGRSDAEIERIHAPVGLDIGAASPAEIAVSIMAQIVDVLRRKG